MGFEPPKTPDSESATLHPLGCTEQRDTDLYSAEAPALSDRPVPYVKVNRGAAQPHRDHYNDGWVIERKRKGHSCDLARREEVLLVFVDWTLGHCSGTAPPLSPDPSLPILFFFSSSSVAATTSALSSVPPSPLSPLLLSHPLPTQKHP